MRRPRQQALMAAACAAAVALFGASPVRALVGVQQAHILPTDGAADDWFGRNVALHGDSG